MRLNCKVGDIAVLIRSARGNEGVIATCTEYLGCVAYEGGLTTPSWAVDRRLGQTAIGSHLGVVPDAWLRPIRDPGDEAVDQTLIDNPAPAPSVLSPKPMKEHV
jgi:hypothetical protein